jgi:hypothetical protein
MLPWYQDTNRSTRRELMVLAEKSKGPRYVVNLEGREFAWLKDTITVPEIRELAGWDASQPVVEIDLQDNTEKTLAEDAVVTLRPGQGFAKKVKFQRG